MLKLINQRGVTLLEIAIALSVTIVIAYLITSWLNSGAMEATRTAIAEQQTREMVQIAQAARGYYRTQVGSLPAAGTVMTPAWADLINGVRLPLGFGQRSGLPTNEGPLSPLGQRYQVAAIMRPEANDIFEVAVWVIGEPRGRFSAKARISDTEVALSAFNTDVVGLIRTRYSGSVTGGLLPAAQTSLEAGVSGFSISLAPWLGATLPGRSTAVVMSGFVQLATQSELPMPGEQARSNTSECMVAAGATCGSGYRKVAGWNVCEGATGSTANIRQIPTEVGTVSLIKGDRRLKEGRSECGGTCSVAAGPLAVEAGGCGTVPAVNTQSTCNAFTDQVVKSMPISGLVIPYTAEGGVLNYIDEGIAVLNGAVIARTTRCAELTSTYSSSRVTTLANYPFGGSVAEQALCCR